MDYFDKTWTPDLWQDWGKTYCHGILHQVEKGDTLYKISRKYQVPLNKILLANPYVDVYNLQVGEDICVPMPKARFQKRDEDVDRDGIRSGLPEEDRCQDRIGPELPGESRCQDRGKQDLPGRNQTKDQKTEKDGKTGTAADTCPLELPDQGEAVPDQLPEGLEPRMPERMETAVSMRGSHYELG